MAAARKSTKKKTAPKKKAKASSRHAVKKTSKAKASKKAPAKKKTSKKSATKTTKTTKKASRGAAPARSKATSASRSTRSAGRKPASGRAATKAAAGRGSRGDRARALFAEALERSAQGFLFDALAAFRDTVKADPKGDLADDALFNVGGLCLQMGLLKDAETAFTELLERYPDATIAAVAGGQEFGRTAAKAHLGRLRARLAQGDQPGARADLMALAAYTDSWVVDASGARRTFHDVGVEAFG